MNLRNSFYKTTRLAVILLVILLIVSTALSACDSQVVATPSPAVISSPAPTSPQSSNPTPSPAPLLQLPALVGTPLPSAANKISADNVNQLVELAQWGNERGTMTDIVLSPDGKQIAISTSLGIYIFDSDTLEQISYINLDSFVTKLAFSPDGKVLAIVNLDDDNNIHLINVSDGKLIRILEGKKGAVTNLVFSPDGTQLATAINPSSDPHSILLFGSYMPNPNNDSTISLWQISDGSLLKTKLIGRRQLQNLVFSTDGKLLFTGDAYGQSVFSYRTTDLELSREYKGPSNDSLLDIALSSDGTILSALYMGNTYLDSEGKLQGCPTGSCQATVLWNTSDGAVKQGIRIDKFTPNIAISSDNRFVAMFSGAGASIQELGSSVTQSFDLEELPKSTSSFSPFYPSFLKFTPDGKALLMSDGNILGKWDVPSKKLVKTMEIKVGSIAIGAISPDGKKIATIDELNFSNQNQLWDVLTGSSSIETFKDVSGVTSYAFSPDGQWLALGTKSGLTLWPLSGSIDARKVYQLASGVGQIAFSPDSSYFVVRLGDYGIGAGYQIQVHLISDGSTVASIPVKVKDYKNFDSSTMTFSPDGKYLMVGTGDLEILQTADWKTIKDLPSTSAAFSPDGKFLAYGNKDGSIQLSGFPDLNPLLLIPAQAKSTKLLAFSQDGTILVSSAADNGTLDFWSVSDGKLLRELKVDTAKIFLMAFLPDGKEILTISQDATIRFWGLKP